MMTKFKNTPARKAGQIRGLVIEQHVSEWFRQHYSDEFEEPDNYRQWTRYCPHDFKLNVGGKIYPIDVSGPHRDGTFGSYEKKPKYGVDYHIITSAIGFASWDKVDYSQGFEILGVVHKNNYTMELDIGKLQFTLSKFLTSIGLSSSNLD